MKYPTLIGMVACLAMTTFIACDKDDDDDNNKTVYQKSGIVMNGAQETPPVTTSASGSMDVSYDKTTKMLSLSAMWAGLSGEPFGAHIHGTAPKGQPADVKVDMGADVSGTSGSFTKQVPVDGVLIKEDSLLLGYYYFNIHTPTNQGGEIRGQIEF
jgi:hypothetical protein